ncbi:MAG TPA: D-alanine--D-alanine ligase [Clostridiaceae bacterium]|nr:D-alanine--D-alanine ligase [Clostridiaceae bacterium]
MDISQIKVCVLFGGQSNEHDISRLSVSYIISVLQESAVKDLQVIGITQNGEFKYYDGPADLISDGTWLEHESIKDVLFKPGHQGQGFYIYDQNGSENQSGYKNNTELTWIEVDVFFPVLHGKMGEDGTIQGLFELLNTPFVGCGVLASSIAMDKVASRNMFDTVGIPQANWTWLKKRKFYANPDFAIEAIKNILTYPIFVKPANAGSSVGITKANSDQDLLESLAIAFEHDDKAILEQAIVGREIEVAVLELTDSDRNLFVSVPGEIIPDREFYDFESKYISDGSILIIPAELEPQQIEEINRYAKLAFRTVDGKGLCRADFFLEKSTGRILINEINTMPGFTGISMYPKLMAESGYPSNKLVEALIASAFK